MKYPKEIKMANNKIHSRVLVIDDEERVREDLQAIFEPLGYDVKVVTGSNNTLLDNAKSLARQFRPHIVIVDLRLLLHDDPADRSGFNLLKELGPTHCILYSAYINPETSRELAKFKAAGWIGKEEPPQLLVDLVNKIANESSAAQKNFKIEKNSVSFEQISYTLFGMDAEVPSSMIEDILFQMFHDTPGINIEAISGAVKTPTSVNRGRSAILKVKRKDKIEPFIVKVAMEKDISREYQNYKEYIDGNLRGNFNAILKGEPQIFWDMGAVVYNFLGSPDQSMTEFITFYKKEQDSNLILKPLQTFFKEVWYGLYSGEKKEITTPLYFCYENNLGLQKRLINYPDQTERRPFRGLNANLLNPVTWVLKHKTDSSILDAHQAVTHGDLHGYNMFVDGAHAWVIDFERSGWGHILRDFTELEVDILTRLAWKTDDIDINEFFYLLTCLADLHYSEENPDAVNQLENHELRKAFLVVAGLRSLAREVTKFGDFREYIWSLLFDSVFVATHTAEEDPQHERSLLYCSVLCSRLQEWGKAWPPQSWASTLTSI
jgi:CheY-like chemotaxis protein